MSSRERQRRRFGLSLVLPALAVYAVLILYPFLNSVRLSFFRSTLTVPEPLFVGIANFQRLAQDATFLSSSPCQSNTGDFHPSIADEADDR